MSSENCSLGHSHDNLPEFLNVQYKQIKILRRHLYHSLRRTNTTLHENKFCVTACCIKQCSLLSYSVISSLKKKVTLDNSNQLT